MLLFKKYIDPVDFLGYTDSYVGSYLYVYLDLQDYEDGYSNRVTYFYVDKKGNKVEDGITQLICHTVSIPNLGMSTGIDKFEQVLDANYYTSKYLDKYTLNYIL